MSEFTLLYVTCSSKIEARKIVDSALENKLIACANIFPEIESVYKWQGKIESQKESVLILKTLKSKLDELKSSIIKNHSYDCPCILSLDVASINEGFSDFLISSVN